MEVILLQRIINLGQIGEIVKVRDGYARNYLLPQKKALRANEANKILFQNERHIFETKNIELKEQALNLAQILDKKEFIVIRSAGEAGHLYGSVSARDIIDILNKENFIINRSQINLNTPIKSIGLHEVTISLHPEVDILIKLNVSRSEEEAKYQATGKSFASPESYYVFDQESLEEENLSDFENEIEEKPE
ncbi:LSU ribosomal protein L9p [Liberibacter crescens BT-1]|uniref:Large ribosomal subunit protein bL9 n=1 Tax=Liberibacter crescens (strain BT-1) TaxID=1215343 RepID=L0EV88_LIBCB|nr:50S ribosomal protein L9 [Liberibacter crescens]AGA64311.1 LSU ribosomal protein L9p [Liberibacter crescens BT-1]AMC12524.1 50S ribosomal protein L9 [Liberibacter crescens]